MAFIPFRHVHILFTCVCKNRRGIYEYHSYLANIDHVLDRKATKLTKVWPKSHAGCQSAMGSH